ALGSGGGTTTGSGTSSQTIGGKFSGMMGALNMINIGPVSNTGGSGGEVVELAQDLVDPVEEETPEETKGLDREGKGLNHHL
ncbi:hypothetical protein KI387_038317, partial [Taxus chinensis]